MSRGKSLLAITIFAAITVWAEVPQSSHQILLDVDFEPRNVAHIEIGDFHFRPGQHAAVHTHAAPAIGYVSEGTIYFQVEGQPAQILKSGDAFYEPAGPRIVHFDNISSTENAVFTDFNLERTGEPYIVFPKPPTEKVDRRPLPTAPVSSQNVRRAVAYADRVTSGKPWVQKQQFPIVGYVADGSVSLQVGSSVPQKLAKGTSFYALAGSSVRAEASSRNAKIVTFQVRAE